MTATNPVSQTIVATLAICLMMAGCASNHQETVTHHDGVTDIATHDPGLASDRETRRSGRMVYEDRVPSTATDITRRTVLTDGPYRNDSVLLARPLVNGDIWVVDSATGQIVYGGHLLKGQTLLINLDRNELSFDNHPISSVHITGTRPYKIYFLPG